MAREAVKMVTSGHHGAVTNDRYSDVELAPPVSTPRLSASQSAQSQFNSTGRSDGPAFFVASYVFN